MTVIFNLDGTLSDNSHRIGLIDPSKSPNYVLAGFDGDGNLIEEANQYYSIIDRTMFKPDWEAYHDACDIDTPIKPVIAIFGKLSSLYLLGTINIEIWTNRPDSIRKKTLDWLEENCHTLDRRCLDSILKMQKNRFDIKEETLKNLWLNQRCEDLIESFFYNRNPVRHDIEYVFDSHKESIEMWRNKGVFVFDCNQYKDNL
jgi:hypothetical protein